VVQTNEKQALPGRLGVAQRGTEGEVLGKVGKRFQAPGTYILN